MADATPKPFKPQDADTPLRIENLVLHRAFETDKAGRTRIHVWVTAEATPVDEPFQSVTADIAFVLGHDGETLGTCPGRVLTFDKPEPQTVHADGDLRLDLNAEVTTITAKVDVMRLVHATAEQTFDPG